MVRILLLIFTFFLVLKTSAQRGEEKIFFTEALALHLTKYEKKAKDAYFYRDYERGKELFDSLVNFQLSGSYMNDFKFFNLKGQTTSLYEFKKPLYFITYASWCVTSKGEIPALNELAEKYSAEIDFVVLFWDHQKAAKEAGKAYNKAINIVYVDELQNKNPYVISMLKHSLGLPTTFLLDEKKKVLDIRRGVTHPYGRSFEDSLDANYNSIYDGIANHLLGAKEYEGTAGPVASN